MKVIRGLMLLTIQFSVVHIVWAQGCPDFMNDWILTIGESYDYRDPDYYKVLSYQPGLKDPNAGFDIFPANSDEVLWVGNNDNGYYGLYVSSDMNKTGYITPENNKVMVRYAVVVEEIPPGTTLVAEAELSMGYGVYGEYYGDCTYSSFKITRQTNPIQYTEDGAYLYLEWSTFFIDLSSLETPLQFPEIGFQLRPARYQDANGNTRYTHGYIYIDVQCGFPEVVPTAPVCAGETVYFKAPFESPFDDGISWNLGNGDIFRTEVSKTFDAPGTYPVRLDYYPTVEGDAICGGMVFNKTVTVKDCKVPPFVCETCIPDFSPLPGERYVINGWVRQGDGVGYSTYTDPALQVDFSQGTVTEKFRPAGTIIDGWQQVTGEFQVPDNATRVTIKVINDNEAEEVFFDDIRVQPFNSSLKSFVYDPVSLRLVAELDERNYASFYEYDEEGKLVRVKKETERGVKTISESRMAMRKRKP